MDIMNIILMMLILIISAGLVLYFLNKKKNQEVEDNMEIDDKTYTLEKMTDYVKKRL